MRDGIFRLGMIAVVPRVLEVSFRSSSTIRRDLYGVTSP